MSKNEGLTFEEVNNHVEKHFTTETHAALSAGGTDICSIYTIVRPILVLVSQAIFIPQKWREAVKILIGAIDAICPGH
ncbi:hypothetical protein [Mucilaginibacter dorajii]|uniref:Uncharacterized protein n=1 Tax=Mucilaginibacter dorajii TaxID=692994 RepID=A0ABP7R6P4_9SPHI|nr:hypothetical protein [Mucilaginibacter dorajii]MCS3737450.1 hypothetical protein [Mucilaginibacter dorajii]